MCWKTRGFVPNYFRLVSKVARLGSRVEKQINQIAKRKCMQQMKLFLLLNLLRSTYLDVMIVLLRPWMKSTKFEEINFIHFLDSKYLNSQFGCTYINQRVFSEWSAFVRGLVSNTKVGSI